MERVQKTRTLVQADPGEAQFMRKAVLSSAVAAAVLATVAVALVLLFPLLCYMRGDRLTEQGELLAAAAVYDRSGLYLDAPSKAQSCRLERMRQMLAAGEYDAALQLFTETEDTDEASALREDALRQRGMARYAAGEYTAALEDLTGLSPDAETLRAVTDARLCLAREAYERRDWDAAKAYLEENLNDTASKQLMQQVRYAIADETLRMGDAEGCMAQLEPLYAAGFDVAELYVEAARTLYPDAFSGLADEEVWHLAMGSDTASMERKGILAGKRAELREGILALGNAHTAALRDDGTVLACGSNAQGQCKVSDWTDIVAVAAGAYHTVGLRKDGTVVAAGDNSYGQCKVSEYTDVTAVTAFGRDTVLTLRDGSVVCLGFHKYAVTDDWLTSKTLSAGGYALMALLEDGSVLSTRTSFVNDAYYDLAVLSASAVYSAAVTRSGAVVTTAPVVPDWPEMLTVDATSTGMLGIDVDGAVQAVWFRASDTLDVSAWQDVVAVQGSGTHIAAVFRDGTVAAMGENGSGQCGVEDWKLW